MSQNTLFKNFILFKANLPYELKYIQNSYIFKTDIELDDSIHAKSRRFLFYKNNLFVEKQKVPPTDSYFSSFNPLESTFSYNISEIEVQVEIFDDEIETIKEYFNDRKITISRMSHIFQNILLVFARVYNESMAGESFLNPVVSYYGPFICSLYLENENENPCSSIIAGSYSLPTVNTQNKLDLTKLGDTLMWRYYFNKAKYSYDKIENLDAILFSAMSLESYVVHLIKINSLEDEVDKVKNSVPEHQSISFFQEVKILKDNSIITSKQARMLNKYFGKIKIYRNKIVHGDIDTTFMSRNSAKESIDSLIDYYGNFENNLIN